MDPLHFAIAVLPLAMYLLLMGAINVLPWPFVTSGARDTAALGVAICGMVVAGPMELFMPQAAASHFRGWVWLLLLMFYFLCLVLVVLLGRPRLVIYNVSPDQVRPVLAGVVSGLDKDFRWAGESLILPNLGVQLYVESRSMLRSVQLLASGRRQSYPGWRRLHVELARALRANGGSVNPLGFVMLACGLLLIGGATTWIVGDQDAVAEALNVFLWQTP